jgi:hypothetical protein
MQLGALIAAVFTDEGDRMLGASTHYTSIPDLALIPMLSAPERRSMPPRRLEDPTHETIDPDDYHDEHQCKEDEPATATPVIVMRVDIHRLCLQGLAAPRSSR